MTTLATEGRVFANVEIREVETTDSLTMMQGLAVPYDEWANLGWFLESFARGSLTKSINEAAYDLPLNVFHEDRSFPIGAADEWKHTDAGLVGTWRLDDSEMAQRAARQARDGLLRGLSIEFLPIRSTWEDAEVWDPSAGPEFMDKVTRQEARLVATGLVQGGAYVKAAVQLVRSADARHRAQSLSGTPVLDALRRETEALRGGQS